MTAATLPSPADTAKISTHKTVGTARINAITHFTAFATPDGAVFLAQSSEQKKAAIAPKIVERVPRQNVKNN